MPLKKRKRKTVNRDGATAIIINKKGVLLLKRTMIPFISNPGIWFFITGGHEKGESYLENAYREINEETGLERGELTSLYKNKKIILTNGSRKIQWSNALFIFRTSSSAVKLNYEHRSYKWVTFDELLNHEGTLNAIYDRNSVLKLIKGAIRSKDRK